MSNLEKLREVEGITYEKLGERCGMDPSEVCKGLRGKRALSPADRYLIRRALTLLIAEKANELDQIVHA